MTAGQPGRMQPLHLTTEGVHLQPSGEGLGLKVAEQMGDSPGEVGALSQQALKAPLESLPVPELERHYSRLRS